MNQILVPGDLVRHPEKLEWGIGQVQSVATELFTVNFEETGKVSINSENVELMLVHDAE